MQEVMNLKIKFRESFRPFAPCVLREHVHEWFGMKPNQDSPYMLLVAPVLERHRTALSEDERSAMLNDADLLRRVKISRSTVPAITHVDCSARVQTVDERHGLFRRVMEKFYEKTGCPVIVNTSFNLSWEPIVCTPQEAYNTFMQSEMDVLVLENFLLQKSEQPLGFRAWSDGGPAERSNISSPWADPRTGEPLVVTTEGALNPATMTQYPVKDGIPRLFLPTEDRGLDGDTTADLAKKFHQKTPFPNYDDVDNVRALLEKARGSAFTRLLNEQIPFDARVVEVGCGTGQLTNFLSIGHRSVLGIDTCLNSLTLAQNFKNAHGLERATFAQMNLVRPALRDEFFDFVISSGGLHQTDDPRAAFARISRLARPGGFIVASLCNAYGRKMHRLPGALGKKRTAWFHDRSFRPHESCHTLDEVFGWLEENNLDFVNAIPKPAGGAAMTECERLFEARDPGSKLSRMLSQLRSMPKGYQEGGFFIVIARRR